MSKPLGWPERGAVEPRGFTLLEVVIALLVVELAVIAGAGVLVLASTTLTRAERLQRAIASAEAVLDTVVASPVPSGGIAAFVGGELRWQVEESGEVVLRAVESTGDTLFAIGAIASQRPGVP